MGNTLDNRPDHYSSDVKGSMIYKGDYMQTYKQQNPNADAIKYGGTRLQFGAKIMQDIDSSKRQGDYYIVQNNGVRTYLSHAGKIYSNAQQLVTLAKGYGNGPAIMISGSPLKPTYNMFYASGGYGHGKSNEWTPRQVNSPADIAATMTSTFGDSFGTKGKYANMYGDASINPFSQEGRNFETEMYQFQSGLVKVIAATALPIAEMALDDIVPFASTLLNITGANKAIQSGINSLAGLGKSTASVSAWDPQMSNMIKDPRLPGYLNKIEDQSHQLINKYGPSSYQSTQRLSQDTPQQMIHKAQQLADENKQLFAQSKVQEMQDLTVQLKKILPPGAGSSIFNSIKAGLAIAGTPQQKMNIIEHFSEQIKDQLLPLLDKQSAAGEDQTQSTVKSPPDLNHETASAQVGHPVLSINGIDSRHPAQTIGGETMSSAPPKAG
jgi:hypothetical protein